MLVRILIEFPASAKDKSHCQLFLRATKARETFARVVYRSAEILNESLYSDGTPTEARKSKMGATIVKRLKKNFNLSNFTCLLELIC